MDERNKGSRLTGTKIKTVDAAGAESLRSFRLPSPWQIKGRFKQIDVQEQLRDQMYADVADAENPDFVNAALDRVRAARDRLEAYTWSPRRAVHTDIGLPTPERRSHARAVVTREVGSPPEMSSLIATPMTLCDARDAVISAMEANPKTSAPLRRMLSALDHVLHPVERYALERFFEGTLAAQGKIRITNYTGVNAGGNGNNIMPINDRSRREMQAANFVFWRIPIPSQQELQAFYFEMIGESQTDQPSLIELAKQTIGTTDERKAMGAYLATFRKIGQELYHAYIEFETLEVKTRNAKKNLASRSTGCNAVSPRQYIKNAGEH